MTMIGPSEPKRKRKTKLKIVPSIPIYDVIGDRLEELVKCEAELSGGLEIVQQLTMAYRLVKADLAARKNQ